MRPASGALAMASPLQGMRGDTVECGSRVLFSACRRPCILGYRLRNDGAGSWKAGTHGLAATLLDFHCGLMACGCCEDALLQHFGSTTIPVAGVLLEAFVASDFSACRRHSPLVQALRRALSMNEFQGSVSFDVRWQLWLVLRLLCDPWPGVLDGVYLHSVSEDARWPFSLGMPGSLFSACRRHYSVEFWNLQTAIGRDDATAFGGTDGASSRLDWGSHVSDGGYWFAECCRPLLDGWLDGTLDLWLLRTVLLRIRGTYEFSACRRLHGEDNFAACTVWRGADVPDAWGINGSTADGDGSTEAVIDCGALTACRRQPTAGDGGALCPCAGPGTDSQARVKDGNALEQLLDALQAWMVSCGLSLWLLSFLGLLRMLFFAIQLKGGERNVDPAVRLGRRFLAGVPVRALFVVQFAGCCSIGQAMPAHGQDSWNCFTIFEMNSEMDVGVGSAPTVEFVGPALPTLFIPERDTAPWNWPGFTEDDEDSPDMQQEEEVVNWIAPVAVRSFECHDAYYTIYTRTDESVAEVCQEIVELVAEGEDDTIVLPVQPQPYSDIFETILTYTWVLGLGHVPALIDCSTFGQGRFVTYLKEPITIEYVQRIVGDKWREGAQIFCGNEEWPLRPREEHTSHHGILIRVHNPEEPRPDLLWAEQKLRCPTDWARDTRERSLPQLQTGLGYVCLLGFCAPSVVIPARAPIGSLTMRDRVSDILHLQPESFLMKPPRGQILDLAVRGESASGLLGIQPWVTSDKLGVFVDPRHLGFSVASAGSVEGKWPWQISAD